MSGSNSTKTRWIKIICVRCGKAFPIMEKWSHPPKMCEFCRVLSVPGQLNKLQAYFRQRKTVRLTPEDGEYYKVYLSDLELSGKLESLIRKYGKDNEKEIVDGIIHIKRVRKIILQMEKQSKIQFRGKEKKTMPTRLTNMVQGGLPSLGKKPR